MSAHTPGPWRLKDAWDAWMLLSDDEYCVAKVPSTDRANARLIAAAPEMLAKLKEYNSLIPDQEAISLIAKAEGK